MACPLLRQLHARLSNTAGCFFSAYACRNDTRAWSNEPLSKKSTPSLNRARAIAVVGSSADVCATTEDENAAGARARSKATAIGRVLISGSVPRILAVPRSRCKERSERYVVNDRGTAGLGVRGRLGGGRRGHVGARRRRGGHIARSDGSRRGLRCRYRRR